MQGGDTMALLNSLWPFFLMGGIFYFMLWKPQKKEQQKRQDLLLKAEKIAVSEDTVICPLFTNNNTNLIPPELENYYYDVLNHANYTGMRVKQEK